MRGEKGKRKYGVEMWAGLAGPFVTDGRREWGGTLVER
jgi:hypothetical protein